MYWKKAAVVALPSREQDLARAVSCRIDLFLWQKQGDSKNSLIIQTGIFADASFPLDQT